eukprot:PhF_6_TR40940/c0_g1_i2/m.61940
MALFTPVSSVFSDDDGDDGLMSSLHGDDIHVIQTNQRLCMDDMMPSPRYWKNNLLLLAENRRNGNKQQKNIFEQSFKTNRFSQHYPGENSCCVELSSVPAVVQSTSWKVGDVPAMKCKSLPTSGMSSPDTIVLKSRISRSKYSWEVYTKIVAVPWGK